MCLELTFQSKDIDKQEPFPLEDFKRLLDGGASAAFRVPARWLGGADYIVDDAPRLVDNCLTREPGAIIFSSAIEHSSVSVKVLVGPVICRADQMRQRGPQGECATTGLHAELDRFNRCQGDGDLVGLRYRNH
jgi:hypothetical protein